MTYHQKSLLYTMQLEYLYRDLKKLLQYVLMLSFLKLVFKRLKKSNTMYNIFNIWWIQQISLFELFGEQYWLVLGGGRIFILDTSFSLIALHWFEAFFLRLADRG